MREGSGMPSVRYWVAVAFAPAALIFVRSVSVHDVFVNVPSVNVWAQRLLAVKKMTNEIMTRF
jgi:hypothetical protein